MSVVESLCSVRIVQTALSFQVTMEKGKVEQNQFPPLTKFPDSPFGQILQENLRGACKRNVTDDFGDRPELLSRPTYEKRK
ncbi:hypothetical protein CDAR_596781 [Caerostris darwini]|uniref:Uncharacterized protein n=1 Tax=Caerostris darwini TaxID=1538125 RepID=A0AAV4WF58_9ARAC|nr:hypothetical protein CDAR_596781 [Caerostris darwini]